MTPERTELIYEYHCPDSLLRDTVRQPAEVTEFQTTLLDPPATGGDVAPVASLRPDLHGRGFLSRKEPTMTETKPMTLLEISDEVRALTDLMQESDGEMRPEDEAILEAWFAELDKKQTSKFDNYAALIRTFELRASVRRSELERLQIRVRVDENAAKRLKVRLLEYFELNGLQKVETDRYSIRSQNNGGKLAVECTVPPESLPKECQRVKIEPDNDAIRAAIECGTAIDGCRVLPRGKHLRIA